MRGWRILAGSAALAVTLAAGPGVGVGAGAAPRAAAGTKCPLKALDRASKPVEITMWHSMPRANEETLQQLADQFNASQGDVRVRLVSQVDYAETLTKYRAGLTSGDLPDIVQAEETAQQQLIDSGTVLPASVCAKAAHYSFADFLPRVVSYYTVDGQLYAMPFNVSGPVFYYNQQAWRAAGLDPAQPPTNLDEVRAAAEKIKSAGAVSGAPLGLKTEPGFVEHMLAKTNKLFVDEKNGRAARANESKLASKTGREIFRWMGGMVKDGLAAPTPDAGPDTFSDLVGIGNGQYAMAIDTSASLGTILDLLPQYPNVTLGVAPFPGPPGKGGVAVSGGALYMVNRSAPEKQAAAWRFLEFLDEPDQLTTWAIGTGYLPIREAAASSTEMQAYWKQNPEFKVAYDQLVDGVDSPATAGSLIGDYRSVHDAVREGLNSMFLQGKEPSAAVRATAQAITDAMQSYNERVPD